MCIPRARGDEPLVGTLSKTKMYSQNTPGVDMFLMDNTFYFNTHHLDFLTRKHPCDILLEVNSNKEIIPMQYDVDFSAVPNSHWSQWRDEEFDFLCSHFVWEHPAVSMLAQKTRPSHWEFDCDADWVIHNFVYNYWVDDILARKDEVDEDLYYKALEYYHISHFDAVSYTHLTLPTKRIV